MTYARDGNIPYWLSTMPTLGLDDGTPRAPIRIALPDDTLPFPYVLPFLPPPAAPPGGWPSSRSLRPTPANMNADFSSPPIPQPLSFVPAPPIEYLDAAKYWGAPQARPEVPPPSSAHGFHVSPVPQAPSWDSVPTPPADNTAQGFSEPPSPPSWDTAVSPIEYPDLARYWAAPPTPPSAANEQPPAPPPSWQTAAEWKPPAAVPRLSFSGPEGAPNVESSWDHLWPTESPVPKTWHQKSLDALNSLNEFLWHVTPPELRPKVAGVLQFLRSIAPGSGTADSMEAGTTAEAARREGRYGEYAGNLASGMFSAATDWFPPLKAAGPIAKALLVGGGAISPAKRLEAEAMEAAGKSVEEIWRKTSPGARP